METVKFLSALGTVTQKMRTWITPGNAHPPAFSTQQLALLGIMLIALSPFLSCSSETGSQSATVFPESNQVQGWTRVGEPRTFPAGRLWEYIDGDADKYVQAGVRETRTADYRYDEKIEAVADVFVMSDGEGAAKVFESQAAAGSRPVQVGEAARLYQGTLMFRKGRYYVRLIAYEDAPQVPEALTALGKSIASRLD